MSEQKVVIGIVGEGVTEWYYFDALRSAKRYSFKVKPELPFSSHWKDVFKKAKQLVQEGYDRVFCVIDYDAIVSNPQEHAQFKTAKKRLPTRITVILSMPCIEFWFLLHFMTSVSCKEYQNYEEIEEDLKQFIPSYMKKQSFFESVHLYHLLSSDHKEERAIQLAQKIEYLRQGSDSETFPFTHIYTILTYFRSPSVSDSPDS